VKAIRIIVFVIFIAAAIFASGCKKGDKLPAVPDTAKIQINVPAETYPGTKTHLITYNLAQDREIFYYFYKKARKVGMCSSTNLKESQEAFEVMSVSFWGKGINRQTLRILRKDSGEWSTAGYGHVEIYDLPEGFPEYSYSKRALNKLKKWYEKNVPAQYQEIAKSNNFKDSMEYRLRRKEVREQNIKRRQIAIIQTAVDAFYLNCGIYPSSLNDLIVCPVDLEDKWAGPYIKQRQLLDPSGKMYDITPDGRVVEDTNEVTDIE